MSSSGNVKVLYALRDFLIAWRVPMGVPKSQSLLGVGPTKIKV